MDNQFTPKCCQLDPTSDCGTDSCKDCSYVTSMTAEEAMEAWLAPVIPSTVFPKGETLDF